MNKILVGLTLVIAINAFGDNEGIVNKITIVGCKRTKQEDVLTKISSKIGAGYESKNIADDIKAVFFIGEYSDVKVSFKKSNGNIELIYNVTELPVVSKISINGNREIDKEEILKLLLIKEGESFTKKKIKNSIEKMLEKYKEKGFYGSKVEYSEEIVNAEKSNILFTVSEGTKMYVEKIIIKGVKVFSEGSVKGEMETTEAGFLRSGLFKEDEFKKDLERIVAFYKREGHAKAKVLSHSVNTDNIGKAAIEILLEEGPVYHVRSIEFELREITATTRDELKENLKMRVEKTFNQEYMDNDIRMIQRYYVNNGYIFAHVTPLITYDDRAQKVDIVFKIEEEELSYIEDIIITGLYKTKEKVVRRELRVNPGEQFDGLKLQKSQEEIYKLGFFEEMKLDVIPGTKKGWQNIIINLKERQTGTASLGAGYSVLDGITGTFSIAENNFLGNAQRIGFSAEYGGIRRNFEISFFDPWFLDSRTSFGISLFYSQRAYFLDYKELSYGTSIRVGHPLAEYWKGWITYRFAVTDIFDIAESASQEIKRSGGKRTVSSIALEAVHDTRDSPFIDVTRGVKMSGSVEVAGLGGDLFFTRYITDGSWFLETFKKWVFAFHARAGYVTGFEPTPGVPFFERFFMGGTNTIRGYPERGVGPKDETNFFLGGRIELLANIEYRIPIVKQEQGPAGIYFVLFGDLGGTWNKPEDIVSYEVAPGTGLGLRAVIPGTIFEIRLDFGYGFNERYTAPGIRPHFTFGSIF